MFLETSGDLWDRCSRANVAVRRASGGRGTVVPGEGASRVMGGLANEKTSERRSERRCVSVCVCGLFSLCRSGSWSGALAAPCQPHGQSQSLDLSDPPYSGAWGHTVAGAQKFHLESSSL